MRGVRGEKREERSEGEERGRGAREMYYSRPPRDLAARSDGRTLLHPPPALRSPRPVYAVQRGGVNRANAERCEQSQCREEV